MIKYTKYFFATLIAMVAVFVFPTLSQAVTSVEILDKASIRLNDENGGQGIRFLITVTDPGAAADYGIILKYNDGGEKRAVVNVGNNKYNKIYSDNGKSGEERVIQYTAVITGLSNAYLATDFTAQGFVGADPDNPDMQTQEVTRSIQQVASDGGYIFDESGNLHQGVIADLENKVVGKSPLYGDLPTFAWESTDNSCLVTPPNARDQTGIIIEFTLPEGKSMADYDGINYEAKANSPGNVKFAASYVAPNPSGPTDQSYFSTKEWISGSNPNLYIDGNYEVRLGNNTYGKFSVKFNKDLPNAASITDSVLIAVGFQNLSMPYNIKNITLTPKIN